LLDLLLLDSDRWRDEKMWKVSVERTKMLSVRVYEKFVWVPQKMWSCHPTVYYLYYDDAVQVYCTLRNVVSALRTVNGFDGMLLYPSIFQKYDEKMMFSGDDVKNSQNVQGYTQTRLIYFS
jgi:hypothetical protein